MNSDNPTFALSELGQIGVTVSDVEKSVSFYRDTLGLKQLFSALPGLAFFAAGTVRLMLSRPESQQLTVCVTSEDWPGPTSLHRHYQALTGSPASSSTLPNSYIRRRWWRWRRLDRRAADRGPSSIDPECRLSRCPPAVHRRHRPASRPLRFR